MKVGLISKPNFVQFGKQSIRSTAHFSASLLVYVIEPVGCGNFVRELRSFLDICWTLVIDIPSSWLLRVRNFFGFRWSEARTPSSFSGVHAVIGAPAFIFVFRSSCCDWRTGFHLSEIKDCSFSSKLLDCILDKFLLRSFNPTHMKFSIITTANCWSILTQITSQQFWFFCYLERILVVL